MGLCYFEDLEIGNTMVASDHLVTSEEIIDFASRWDPQPYHIDEHLAQNSVFHGLTASGAHTFAIAFLLTHRLDPKPVVLAGLGYDDLRFPKPVRPGNRLSFHSRCIEKRESKSKPDRGIVLSDEQVVNEDGSAVIAWRATLMVARRPAT